MLPQNIPDTLAKKIKHIRLLALDVDGILTNGALTFTSSGEELKSFNILDGLGIKQLQTAGIEVALITGRTSPMVARRAKDLGIKQVQQGREDKQVALTELCNRLDIPLQETAYAGDDLPDLGAIRSAGVGFTVPNGHWYVQEHADYCTSAAGGSGAVREISDLLLKAQGKLDELLSKYL